MKYLNYEEYLATPEFIAVKQAAIELTGGMCGKCRSCRYVDVHHIRYCKWGEFDVVENLIPLCRSCHEAAHTCSKCGRIALKAKHIKRNITICDSCSS